MNLNTGYRLAVGVVIRPERFGGLVYRHDTRRLYFLYSHELVTFLSELDGHLSLGEATDRFIAVHALPPETREAFLSAIEHLEQLHVLDAVE